MSSVAPIPAMIITRFMGHWCLDVRHADSTGWQLVMYCPNPDPMTSPMGDDTPLKVTVSIPDKLPGTVCDAFLGTVLAHFYPICVWTDRGPEFGAKFDALLRAHGMEHRTFASGFRPAAVY